MKDYIESAKLFFVVEIHSKTLFRVHSSVHNHLSAFLCVLQNIGVSRDVTGCSVKNRETKNKINNFVLSFHLAYMITV